MQNDLELKLIDSWDLPQDYRPGKASGIYEGRDTDIDKLISIIKTSSKNSVLISGDRGTGKSTYVNRAIAKAKAEIKGTKSSDIIPVFINACQLEIVKKNDDEGINHQVLLENLIFRLNHAFDEYFNGWILGNYLGGLYKWIYCRSFAYRLSELAIKASSYKWERSSEKKSESRVLVSFPNIIKNLMLVGVLFVQVALISKYLSGSKYHALIQVLSLIGDSLLLSVYYSITKSSKFLTSHCKDYCNLESDFVSVLNLNKKFTFLFVIDETDFLRISAVTGCEIPGEKSPILVALKAYKNLFHYLDATFIMISDRETYEAIDEDNTKKIFSTVFSDSIYLSNPTQKEFSSYLSKIIQDPPEENKDWALFKYFLMYKAKGNFKKLQKYIKSYISYGKNNKIVLTAENFTNEMKMKAKSYKLFADYYENNRGLTPSDAYRNENLFNALYEIIENETWRLKDFSYIDDFEKEQKDFIGFLSKLGILELTAAPSTSPPNTYRLDHKRNLNIDKIPWGYNEYFDHECQIRDTYKSVKSRVSETQQNLKTSIDVFDQNQKIPWIESVLGVNITSVFKNIEVRLALIMINKKRVTSIDATEAPGMLLDLTSIEKSLNSSYYKLIYESLKLDDDYKQLNISQCNEPELSNFFDRTGIAGLLSGVDHLIFYIDDRKTNFLVCVEENIAQQVNDLSSKNGLAHCVRAVMPGDQLADLIDFIEDNPIHIFGKDLIASKGIFSIEDQDIKFLDELSFSETPKGNMKCLAFLDNTVFDKGRIKFKVYFPGEGILNFLLGYRIGSISKKPSYLMARLDTRKTNDDVGDGILRKKEDEFWQYISSKKRTSSDIGTWIDVEIVVSDTGVRLLKDGNEVARTVAKPKAGTLGFLAESGEVIVSRLKVSHRVR